MDARRDGATDPTGDVVRIRGRTHRGFFVSSECALGSTRSAIGRGPSGTRAGEAASGIGRDRSGVAPGVDGWMCLLMGGGSI